jgi:hypothetical protein
MNTVPMLVPVPVQGKRHYLYGALQTEVEKFGAEAVYAKTLCGLPCGPDLVMPKERRRARAMNEQCADCRAEDERRYPDGFNRRILR